MWQARISLVALLTLVLAVVTGLAVGIGAGAGIAVAVVDGLLVVAAGVLVLLCGRYRSWGYAERGDDLLVRRGLLVRRLTVVPYGRMQFIDVTAGPVDRSFSLATLRLHTAAAETDARIPGLASEEAARLRDRLTELGEARAAGL